jgi:hypothetical protein
MPPMPPSGSDLAALRWRVQPSGTVEAPDAKAAQAAAAAQFTLSEDQARRLVVKEQD